MNMKNFISIKPTQFKIGNRAIRDISFVAIELTSNLDGPILDIQFEFATSTREIVFQDKTQLPLSKLVTAFENGVDDWESAMTKINLVARQHLATEFEFEYQ